MLGGRSRSTFETKTGTYLLVMFACMSLLQSCDQSKAVTDAPEASSSSPAKALIVPAIRVGRSTLATNLVLTGEFTPYQEIDVMAKEAGYIKSIRVDIGDRVRSGQLLAELEIPEMQDDLQRAAAGTEVAQADIATAQGNLTRAQSGYNIAELSYKRILSVAQKEPGLIPQQEVDVAQSRQLEAAAQVSAAQANLQIAEHKLAIAQAERGRVQTLQNYTLISAPFTGVITKRYANTGAMIQQGTSSDSQAMPVVRLSQNNLLRLTIPVPESAVGNIRLGEHVDVTIGSLRRTFAGRVSRFEDKLTLATRTMNTEIDVPNDNYTLMPGMYAQVDLHVQQSSQVLAVPLDAIEETDNGAQVYLVNNGKVEIRPVVTGIKTAELEELRSGISAGSVVITGRHAGLQNGDLVEARLPASHNQ